MYEEQENCTLTCDGEEVAMKSVHVHGKLDGLLLRMKVRQTYTNESEDTLETVYTFPLAWGATLLNLAVELNGKRLNGAVIEKKQAVKQYEEAIDNGDSPIMVERSGRGLYTANLGNLLPGETAVIEIEYAQLLSFEADRIRLTIPTTIAPRYGNQHEQGGLQPHQTAAANGLVEYGFFMTLDVHGTAAKGLISSPSHPIKTTKSFDGVNVQLGKQAYLDRDFVLLIEDLVGESFCIAGPDSEGSSSTAIITSFCPRLPAAKPSALRLKVLLDCSGSMAGDSMRQARIGLRHLFKQLNEDDSFAYTRFGSSIDRVTPKMSPAYNERIQNLLSTLERTEADLGGTELGKAMTDVFNMNALDRKNPDAPQSADVLLITDGDVWDIENILASARISGHRVYTIGVGSAPAESLLRELAKDSGGACEFVTPQEDMRGAVDRMLHRMRSAQEVRFAIKWNATEDKHKEHEWASTLPPHLISGETVHLFARLPAKTDKPPVLICKTLIKNEEHEACSAKPTSITWDTEGIVARLCAAAQIAELTESKADTKLARSLAIQYQLVTQHTNLFLLHERAEENKADGLPKLQQVAQMQAAGWAGNGTAFNRKGSEILMCMALPMHDSISSNSYGRLNTPSVWRTNRTQVASGVDGMASQSMNDIEIPAFLRKQSDSIDERAESSSISYREMQSIDPSEVSITGQLIDKVMDWVTPFSHKPPVQSAPTPPKAAPTPPAEASLKDIAQALNTAALQATSFRIALQHTLKLNVPQRYAQVIIDLTKFTKDSAISWALLLEWLLGENGNHSLLDKHAQRLLRSQLKLATVEMHEKAKGLFERALVGGITLGNA